MAKRPKAEPKPKPPTKLEELTLAERQNYTHSDSSVIRSRRELMQFEMSQLAEKIIFMDAELQRIKERGKELQAMVTGLTLVLDKRC